MTADKLPTSDDVGPIRLALDAATEAGASLAEAQAHYETALRRAREAGASWHSLGRALDLPMTTARRHTLAAIAAAELDEAIAATEVADDGKPPAIVSS